MDLEEWGGLERSSWRLRWAPPWEVEICLEASHYISCTLLVCMTGFSVAVRVPSRKFAPLF